MELGAQLHGRQSELATLHRAIESACLGSGSFLVIEADAGMGKSALLEKVRGLGVGLGARGFNAQGMDLERDLAWGVVRQLLEPIVTAAEPPLRHELLKGAAATSATVLMPTSVSTEAAPGEFSILNGLHWLVANLCR